MQCVLGEQFTTWVACVLDGEGFHIWLDKFKEKLPEVTSTTEVREHCTCFCWQGFQHAFVATLSNLCWPNTINMTLCRLFVFVQMSHLSAISKHIFRRGTGIIILLLMFLLS